MKKLCHTCQHWGPKQKFNEIGIFTEVDARYCNLEAVDTERMKSDEFSILRSHHGPVFTGHDFGCIHWEPIKK